MFQISAGLQYALRALINIASSQQVQNIAVISQQENISRKYLESIFTQLKKNRIVRSIRGPEGGYVLCKDASEITLYQIFDAIEGSPVLVKCLDGQENCPMSDACAVRHFWNDYQEYIRKYLDEMTLQDLINKYTKTGDI
ncbi:MAG: Rrf2 family transcriptional regulator [Spirochaetia bacterium]|nr:Rrf2 family transcriptional regulator [Spirochaetia bacterium]